MKLICIDKPLNVLTDPMISKIYGVDAIKIYNGKTNDNLSGSIVYKINSIEVLIWRDRGLHTVHLSRSGSRFKHLLFTIANHMGESLGEIEATEFINALEEQLKFIKFHLKSIENILNLKNIDKILDKEGIYKSIDFG